MDNQQPRFECPYCQQLLTEDELWLHCPRYHGDENKKMICPICTYHQKINGKPISNVPVGDDTWGYSSHLHFKHGPELRKRLSDPPSKTNPNAPTYAFALVVCQHPNGKYLLVKEGCKQGWWLPGGRVDPGENFEEAAIRETVEEAGVDVVLEGILRIEYSPFEDGGARQRIIFFARPKDPNQAPKTIPDFESQGAEWISYEDMITDIKEKRKHLRGREPLDWFGYVERGGYICPMQMLTYEGAPAEVFKTE